MTMRWTSALRLSVVAVALGSISEPAIAQIVGPPVRIDPGGGTFAANETTAAASEFNPDVVIAGWNDWRRSTSQEIINCGFTVSFDGGQSWSDFLLRPPAANQTGVEGDPMTAYDDRTGTLWAGGIAFGGNGGLYVARLDPGETTFEPSVMARVTGSADKGWMIAGPRPGEPNSTRLYITYNQGVIWSDNMGQTWTSPISLGGGIGFLPRIGPNGELYVAYWDFGSGMLLKRSLNGGSSFTTHLIATRMDTWGTQDGSRFPGTFRVPPMCYLAVDPNDGTLYAVYFDTTNIVNNQRNVDLYFTKSTNQGTSWTTPVVINDDGNPPGDQFFPWIEVDESGRLQIVFFDSRHTNQNDGVTNGMFDAYFTFSEDGGTTWNEIRLSPQSWNSNNDGLNRGQQFLGDYLGMAVAGNRAYPAYLDTTLGDPNVYTRVIEFGVTTDIIDFEIFRGTPLGGGLADLEFSDNSYVSARSVFGFSAIEPNLVELRVGAVTGHASPATIDLTIEDRLDHPGGTSRVRLRNWSTSLFQQVAQYATGTTDSTTLIENLSAANRVRSGDGRIEMSIRHSVIATFAATGFRSFFDMVDVEVE